MPAATVASSGSLFASVLLLAGVTAPATGQSTHLAQLERSAPAASLEPVASLATGGWASAWMVPAAGGDALGVLVGLEHSSFAALTSTFVAGRFRLGPVWQATFAQVSLDDLFDPVLLEQFPGLGALGAAATQIGVDGVVPLGPLRISGGLQWQRDELLGEATTVWSGRASAAAPLPLQFRAVGVLERHLTGSGRSAGRFRAGVARDFSTGPMRWSATVGGSLGDLWDAESRRRSIASSLSGTLAGLLTLGAAVGFERDIFGVRGWERYAAIGLGLRFGRVGATVRRGGQGSAEASPTAVSILVDLTNRRER